MKLEEKRSNKNRQGHGHTVLSNRVRKLKILAIDQMFGHV